MFRATVNAITIAQNAMIHAGRMRVKTPLFGCIHCRTSP
jgi:hypothetical protein